MIDEAKAIQLEQSARWKYVMEAVLRCSESSFVAECSQPIGDEPGRCPPKLLLPYCQSRDVRLTSISSNSFALLNAVEACSLNSADSSASFDLLERVRSARISLLSIGELLTGPDLPPSIVERPKGPRITCCPPWRPLQTCSCIPSPCNSRLRSLTRSSDTSTAEAETSKSSSPKVPTSICTSLTMSLVSSS